MWRIIYNLLVHAALPFFLLFSLTQKKIRPNLLERVLPAPLDGRMKDVIWVHAASVGEAVVAEAFIRYLRPRVKNRFLVTTNTYYTRDMLKKKLGGSLDVFSLPLDLPYCLGRFMDGATFAALLLVETEIWPNLIWAAKSRGIPVLIINGRISDATLGRYRRLSFFLAGLLESVDLVLAQSDAHARRFLSLGMPADKVVNTGNLKYYREAGRLPAEKPGEDAVVFGSIREKELPVLIPVIEALAGEFGGLRIFIAPRELTLIASVERQLPESLAVVRYSSLKEGLPGLPSRLVLVDTVGDLVSVYARCLVAFVGGSLAPYGGQNLLEPLFVGTPVIFGPHVENFREIARDIIDHGAGFMVEDGSALLSKMRLVLTDPAARAGLVKAGRAVVELQKDVMEKAAGLVLETIWKNSRSS